MKLMQKLASSSVANFLSSSNRREKWDSFFFDWLLLLLVVVSALDPLLSSKSRQSVRKIIIIELKSETAVYLRTYNIYNFIADYR